MTRIVILLSFYVFVLMMDSLAVSASEDIVPIIDISGFFNGSVAERLEIADKIGQACQDIGFFVIKGHNVPQTIIDDAWGSTQDFFDLDLEFKLPYDLDQHVYPFGYTKFGGEVLSTGKSAEKQGNGSSAVISEASLPDLKGNLSYCFSIISQL
jgi:isopenicillin N synthase-like dioxygenase